MQRVSVSNLLPGMVVARNIHDANGKLLLAGGFTLNQKFIDGLAQQGIVSIYIENSLLEQESVEDFLREETRVAAVKSVKSYFSHYSLTGKADVEQVKTAANQIVDEIILNPEAMVQLTDIRTHNDYTFAHSVNVCALSVLLAAAMSYNQERLRELALGALLHDVGKVEISNAILNKPAQLDPDEWRIMQHHPKAGFQLLKKRGNVSTPAMII